MNIYFPCVLTLFRLLVAPVLVPFFIMMRVYYPADPIWFYGCIFSFFIAASTDFFDGYFARKYQLQTVIGKILDFTADKVFVSSVIISFVWLGIMPVWAAVLLVAREFLVDGLRMLAYEYKAVISVSWLGKVKTTLQMLLLISMVIAGLSSTSDGLIGYGIHLLLTVTCLVSWYSAYDYAQKLKDIIKSQDNV